MGPSSHCYTLYSTLAAVVTDWNREEVDEADCGGRGGSEEEELIHKYLRHV